MVTLRPYQQAGVDALRESLRAGARAPLYVLPTGGGKTAVAGAIAAGSAAKGRIVWFVVPNLILLAQTAAKFAEYGIPCGVIHSGFSPTPAAAVQVITIQTLDRWIKKGAVKAGQGGEPRMYFAGGGRRSAMWAPDLIVLDEGHHASAAQYLRVHAALPAAKWIGVTATPERLDGKGLGVGAGGIYDQLVIGPSIGELIDWGHLTRPVVYAPDSGVDLSGMRRQAGDFAAAEAASRLDKPGVTGSLVEHYRMLAMGKRAIVGCCSIEHSQHVAAEFRAAGIPFAHIDGEMERSEIARRVKALERGELLGLTNVALVNEGFDVPGIEVAICARPTQSLSLCLQFWGRCLRPAPGKDRAIILDHVGNVMRHGLPDDARQWSLSGRAGRAKAEDGEVALRVRQCPKCFAAHRFAPACPCCGHVYVAEAREIAQRDGELREVDREALAALRAQQADEVRKAKSREELEKIAAERGYKPGWVDHQMRFRKARGGMSAARAADIAHERQQLWRAAESQYGRRATG